MYLLYGRVPNTKRVVVLAARTKKVALHHVKASFEVYGLEWRMQDESFTWCDGTTTEDLSNQSRFDVSWAGQLWGVMSE